jgi:hypothetical protein
MSLSRCCKADVYVEGNVTMYYVCTACKRACDLCTPIVEKLDEDKEC